MTTTEMMREYLAQEGYRPVDEPYGLRFKYEGLGFIYLDHDDDPGFFRIVLPGIFDVTEENEYDVLKACNAASAEMKVVKCCIMGDEERRVDVFFEILIDSNPELGDIVPRALDMLRHGRQALYANIEA